MVRKNAHTIINLICDNCHINFNRRLSVHNQRLKRNISSVFCSYNCHNVFRKLKFNKIKCKFCYTEFMPKTNLQIFCNTKCAGQFNAKFPSVKRATYLTLTNHCKVCSILIPTTRVYCQNHRFGRRNMDIMTIESLSAGLSSKGSAVGHIRRLARKLYYQSNDAKCKICNYDKHIEVCHIQPISSFDKKTLINVVNHPSNLIGLCPNHHWELDNGILKF